MTKTIPDARYVRARADALRCMAEVLRETYPARNEGYPTRGETFEKVVDVFRDAEYAINEIGWGLDQMSNPFGRLRHDVGVKLGLRSPDVIDRFKRYDRDPRVDARDAAVFSNSAMAWQKANILDGYASRAEQQLAKLSR